MLLKYFLNWTNNLRRKILFAISKLFNLNPFIGIFCVLKGMNNAKMTSQRILFALTSFTPAMYLSNILHSLLCSPCKSRGSSGLYIYHREHILSSTVIYWNKKLLLNLIFNTTSQETIRRSLKI